MTASRLTTSEGLFTIEMDVLTGPGVMQQTDCTGPDGPALTVFHLTAFYPAVFHLAAFYLTAFYLTAFRLNRWTSNPCARTCSRFPL